MNQTHETGLSQQLGTAASRVPVSHILTAALLGAASGCLFPLQAQPFGIAVGVLCAIAPGHAYRDSLVAAALTGVLAVSMPGLTH